MSAVLRLAALATLSLAIASADAEAALITLQPGPATGKDANIVNEGFANANNGSLDLLIGNWSGNARTIGLVEFDLSPLAGATINSATLSLFHQDNAQGFPATYDVFRITSSWDEATVTYNTAPTFNPVASSSATFTPGSPGDFHDWDVTALAQGWASGSFTNYGMWIEEVPIEGFAVATFTSSDGQAERRPVLVVDYQETSAVPEPASWMLLGTGLVVIGRTFRRARQRSARE